MHRPLPILIAAGFALSSLLCAGPIDFRTQVLPVLSENCFNCHGPDAGTRKGGLRLDRRDDALRPAESGEMAIVPGKPEESSLIDRLLTHDPEEIMPPPESKKKLSPASIETLSQWIKEGAEYRNHWAFEPIERPPVPESSSAWPRNPIDAFVLETLTKHQLQASPEAPKATLLRRLSLDLTGLPPSPEELNAFLADSSPGAYEAAVDRLLASPHYGERMALPWLDAARFADSNGFQQDGDTHQYVWRDWVVRALNSNMPFDQFTIEQLAGDLLPNATLDQKIASAFNRNHLLNGEGGAIPEEQRNVILIDRVDVTATNWLGLTMACAQCHDHKYDPIPQRDFYRMMAFFNHVPETGMPPSGGQYRIADPWIHAGSPDQLTKLAELEKKAAETAKPSSAVLAALTEWEASFAASPQIQWSTLRPDSAISDHEVKLEVTPEHDIFASGPAPDRANYIIDLPAPAEPVTALRIDVIPDARLPMGGSGRADSGNAVLTRLRIAIDGVEVPLASALADYSQASFSAEGVLDDGPQAWAYHPEVTKPHFLMVQPSSSIPVGRPLRLTLEFQSPDVRHQFGRFRISTTHTPNPLARQQLPAPIVATLAKPAANRSKKENQVLLDHFITSSTNPEVVSTRIERDQAAAALKSFRDALPKVMIMSDAKPRKTHIYSRGVYTAPMEEVSSGTPEVLPPMAPDLPANRLGLAKWLMSPENPLTARVQVNRYWQLFFGIGLVKSSENLGVQADPTSHPAL